MGYTDDFYEALGNKKKKKKENASSKSKESNTKSSSSTSSLSDFEKGFYRAMGDNSPSVIDIPHRNDDDDDIAPVASSKGGDKDSWFKSGGFSDGVDGVGDFFGDLGETILGTTADLGIGAVKGVGRMVEGLVDLGTYGVAKAADALGADEFAEKAKDVARYSATDEWTKGAQNYVDQYSVLGNKADAVSEGLGQVAAIILTGGAAGAAGLGSAGVAAVTTGVTGLSAMGTSMGEAYENNATDKEAFQYGLGVGAIEAGTELLFGGLGKTVKALGISRGIGGLDDIFAKKLAGKIAGSFANESVQKALGNTVEYAIKSSGEGFEEVLSGVGSAVMKKLTYEDDESLMKLIEDENLLEQFVVGAVTSSIAQGGDFVKATKSGTDFVTGQTVADEKVVNKVVEDEIAARESAGEKLTDKEKNKIYDSVVDRMEKGQIDIDTIESVLGGDSYKAYTDQVETEESLKAELETLSNIKASDMTRNQQKRLEELEGMNLNDTTKRDGLRKTLDDTLSPMLKNSKISESYRERERRGQAFEADLSKYTGKQRESVERAIKSGVLNNTYRSHELVDVLSKIEAEKGIVFDYTNNAKLKESGFAVEGMTVNGFANKKAATVTLNVQSSKAWQSVVGHEITHVLENTEAYGALRETLYAYANSKGELESRRASLTDLYRNMNADIEAELTADLVGDYLFSDKAFVNHLTGNESLFRKIYEEIKYLCKVATGKELTEIEKVKHEFDRVWKEYSAPSEDISDADDSGEADIDYSVSVTDKETLDSLNEQVARGEYDAETNPDGGYYVTYKSMSFWGYDDEGNAILRSPMAEYVDGELSNAYLIPEDKSKLNWYQATETIDDSTGLPSGLLVKTKQDGKKSFSYLPASENQDLINEDWSNLYFNLRKKILKNGKWVNSDVPARYNPYEHSSNSMLNDQFTAAYQRDNLVTVKMIVPISEDNGAYRAKWSKDPTGWSDWKSGIVAGKIGKQKDLQRRVYLSRYAAPVEIVPDSEVAQAYKGYLEGTDVAIPDNVVSPNLLNELKKAGVPIEESGKVQYSISEIVDENNNSYGMGVKLDSTLLDNLTPDERVEMVKERVKELGGSTFTAYDNNGNAVDVTIAKSSRTFKNKNGRRVSVNKDLTTKYNKNETKQEAVVLVDELIETAHYLNSDPAKHPHDWLDNNGKNDWERWTTYIEDKNNTIWEATLNVANATNGEKILYDISPIKKVGRSGKSDTVPTDKSVPQNPDIVNTQLSISPETDAAYMSAVERGDTETAQMMVDEAAKNAGYTRKLYHGTASKFNVFGFGRTGIFTTNNFDMAKTYGNNVMSLYGKEGAKVLTIDAKESPHWSIEVSKDVLDFSEYPLMRGKDRYSTNDISLIAFREGYDVVVIDNVYDNYSAASGNTENGLGTDVVYKDPNQVKSSEAVTYDDNGNVIPLSERFNEKSDDIRNSLSNEGEEYAPVGNYSTPFRELALEDIAPTSNTSTARADTPTVQDENVTDYPLPDEPIEEAKPVAEDFPMPESDEDIIKTVKERLNAKITNSATELEETKLLRDWVKASYDNKIEKLQTTLDSKKNKDTKVAIALRKRIANLKRVSADIDADIQKRISDIESRISKATDRLQDPPKKDLLEVRYERIDKQLEEDKIALKEDFDKRKVALWESTQDKAGYISNKALDLYNEVKSMRKGVRVSGDLGYLLDNLDLSEEHKAESYKRLRQALIDIKNRPNNTVNQYSEIESIAREMLNASYEDAVYDLDDMDSQYQKEVERLEADAEAQKNAIREQAEALHRADVQRQKLAEVESHLNSKGFSLDSMLDNPVRQLSTLETVDTMPQRVMEKTFGYEAGQALADATVNKVAQNESAGLKWLDSITNRKDGLLAQLSKQYDIKPHSKEVAAAMMYGEGSWVNEETGEEFAYGDAELAKDFPNVKVQNNIKALVRDPRIRQFYDETLDAINKSRKRNGYPEIPRRANYFLHYRELGDFFTKHGLPFNPNDARAKDLPTDMVGRTADLKPGQPFFTSSWQRKGNKTSYDLFEGMERYANSAKNQIYHIDDIQTFRALHYHLAERFGQAQGLENLNKLTPEEASEQIKKVYGSHLSTFAAFLDTEANILAGKTSMIDRALSEGMLGRRVLTFMDALNQQTGATMVGYNVSSANTNWLPVVREFANSNPVDSVKALAQTVANIASRGKLDSFREDSTVYIRRQGADRFNRKLWQKMQDPAYALMGAVDSISTEIIARTEYNKAIREGKSETAAHFESDKKTSRLMADRSLGQMPQMYTSRVMGLITKFQLEVRNDMDSMFYDTVQEEKLSRKDIENALERNAKTAAKVAWRYGATAIALHAFGQAFEAVAGYNPAFDIIEAITKAFGWDDDEDDEDTWRDNLGEGAMSLLEDLPYAGIVLDGGRIPISSAIPDLKGMIEGKDEYGNDKSVVDHIKEIAPYMLPAGGNQLKKTVQGLKMFSDDHPVTGSYTDSGSLRFPVEATPLNVAQAAIFGQYASKNAREYFDNDYAPLKEKQIQEYIDVDMPIKDYWEYREGLNDIAPLPGKSSVTLEQKLDYVDGLDLPTRKKNILVNNLSGRKDPIDMTSYGDYDSLEEFDFATDKPEKYAFAKSVGGYSAYKTYSDALYDIKADKDENGKSINGSRKEKVLDYINNLDADYYTKILLWKSEYPSDDSYDYEIIEYLNNRSDMSYTDRVNALTELGFRVTEDGQIYVD